MNDRISVAKPPHFSFQECLWFLNRNYDDCLFKIQNKSITKAIVLQDQQFLIRIFEDHQCLVAEILAGKADDLSKKLVKEYIEEWFDVGRDIQPFYDILQREESLSYMVEKYNGLRLVSITDVFEAICWGIIGQQINLTFAYKLKRRLVENYGSAITFEGEQHYVFPEPEVLARLDPEDLRPLQFSQSKAKYIVTVARAFAEGIVSNERMNACSTLAEKQKLLTDLKGVGVWTANYVLMKSLREPSSIPHGDVGLLQALQNHKIIDRRDENGKISEFFQKYQNWESYLVFYLWRSLSVKDI